MLVGTWFKKFYGKYLQKKGLHLVSKTARILHKIFSGLSIHIKYIKSILINPEKITNDCQVISLSSLNKS